MYYRYVARRGKEEPWRGICQVLTPTHRRQIARFLAEPKCLKEGKIDGECWFTQYGYDKYHERMESLIQDCLDYFFPIEVKVLTEENLKDVIMSGKVQAVRLKS